MIWGCKRALRSTATLWSHRFISIALAIAVSSDRAEAGALDVALWMESTQRCYQAMITGTKLETNGYVALWDTNLGGEVDWPEYQAWKRGRVAIFQEIRPTGATAPIRVCSVHLQPGVEATSVDVIVENVTDWAAELVEEGVFAPKKTRRKIENGTVVFLQAVKSNGRDCAMSFEFLANPEVEMASLTLKEKPSQTCGASTVGGGT